MDVKYQNLRKELKDFYWDAQASLAKSKAFAEKCFGILDKRVNEEMTVLQQKVLQYHVIVEECPVTVFENAPFYFETGVLSSLSDGANVAKNGGHYQANGWVYARNKHFFKEYDRELWGRKQRQAENDFYLICGPYNDVVQHFNFNNRPILDGGLRGIYERAKADMPNCKTVEERGFLEAVCEGMLALRRLSEKFSIKAREMFQKATDEAVRKNLKQISEAAARVPWEAPRSFYEALCCLAFMRTALGSLEGVGPNTFGRLDLDLYPFYRKDVEAERLTQDEAYELICQFLLIWDLHYDHDMKMVSYADHELENTYTLGGVDRAGNIVYNELTRMFLRATREEQIIFPKIKCRYCKASPKEYLDEIDISVIDGTSTILYQNDEATIPALVNGGVTLEEARDYVVTGCWGVTVHEEKYDHGSYVNLLKAFEYAVHNLQDKIRYTGICFDVFDGAVDFETVYGITVANCRKLIQERLDITRKGARLWHKVDALPIFSSTLKGCLENRRDHTQQGGKYNDDHLLMFGLPNIVDSLLVIKKLVFEQKKYTLAQLLEAVRSNWEEHEDMRMEAIRCNGWGDGSEESCAMAKRFNRDLYEIVSGMEGSYGGRVHMGHLTYTEIRFWGERTLATPDGRRNGEYFSQGLTPSRLKKISAVTDVINSMKCLERETMAANNVVNIILPGNKVDKNICEAFLRAISETAIMSLQLNCVTREQLLDAQKHPEKYPELIVRVCGFSARFTSLSPEWQEEVLSRNFYK